MNIQWAACACSVLSLVVATAAAAQDHPLAEPDWKTIGAPPANNVPPPNVVSSPAPTTLPDEDDEDATPPGHVVQEPDWLTRPSSTLVSQYYPHRAALARISGEAMIPGAVTVAGTLDHCRLKGEYPSGYGFGQATLAMAQLFRMRPKTVDGRPVGGATVNIPLTYFMPEWGTNLFGVVWRSAPSASQVAATYPTRARPAKVSGQVLLNCAVGDQSRLEKCKVLSETPLGYDFGSAAMKLAADFVAPATDSGGTSTKGDRTQITVAFDPGVLDSINPTIGTPHWVRVPNALDAPSAFPEPAQAAHVLEGHATLDCSVIGDGKLDHCAISNEDPVGLGFGAAALAMAGQFQMTVWTDDGLPTVGGRIEVPIRYLAPGVKIAKAEDPPDTAEPPPPVVPEDSTHWAHKPLAADYGAAYPPAAANLGLSGEATLHCAVIGDGRLRGCKVLRESPSGYGFGQAAVTVAAYYRAAPEAGPEVTFPVRFSISGH